MRLEVDMTRRRKKADKPQAWHVISRGSRRMGLFHDADDFRAFLGMLCLALGATGCLLWAYTLMSNHYHLMIYGTSAALSDCMRRVNRAYACYYNKKRGMHGHAYETRYKAYLQGSPMLLLQRIAYIFLNPVTAGLVDRPEDYEWSGYRAFRGLAGSPCPQVPLKRLSEFSSRLAVSEAQFDGILRLEACLTGVRRGRKMAYSAREVLSHQFQWLLEYGRTAFQDSPEDALHAAILTGSKAGIPPGAMAEALEGFGAPRVRKLLSRIRKQVEKDPLLEDRLTLK